MMFHGILVVLCKLIDPDWVEYKLMWVKGQILS